MCEKNTVARGVRLHERRAGKTGDLRLRSGLDGGRTDGKIELREAGAARAGGAAFAAHGDENRLRAGGGNSGGAGIQEARHAADRDSCAGASVGAEKINVLRAEIGDDYLPALRR